MICTRVVPYNSAKDPRSYHSSPRDFAPPALCERSPRDSSPPPRLPTRHSCPQLKQRCASAETLFPPPFLLLPLPFLLNVPASGMAGGIRNLFTRIHPCLERLRKRFGGSTGMAGAKDAAEARAMDKPLSETEEKRLRRFRRSTENRRGRTNPAIVPSKLARTSAFVPRRHGLSADGSFESVYVVRPHTVVHVHGRELGSQHRDAIYAIFRSRARKVSEPNIAYVLGSKDPLTAFPRVDYYYAQTTWRDLLLTTGRTAHVNNLGSLLGVTTPLVQMVAKPENVRNEVKFTNDRFV